MLHSVQKLLHIFKLDYTITPPRFQIRGEKGDSLIEFSPIMQRGGHYDRDFAVIANGTAPDGSKLLLLLGFSEGGVIEASRVASDPTLMEVLEKNHLLHGAKYPSTFTLVVGTGGINQEAYDTNIRYFLH